MGLNTCNRFISTLQKHSFKARPSSIPPFKCFPGSSIKQAARATLKNLLSLPRLCLSSPRLVCLSPSLNTFVEGPQEQRASNLRLSKRDKSIRFYWRLKGHANTHTHRLQQPGRWRNKRADLDVCKCRYKIPPLCLSAR